MSHGTKAPPLARDGWWLTIHPKFVMCKSCSYIYRISYVNSLPNCPNCNDPKPERKEQNENG